MKKCYVFNAANDSGLEIYQIGEEKKLLDRIRTMSKYEPDDEEKKIMSKFIDGDHSIFHKSGLRGVSINRESVYLATIR